MKHIEYFIASLLTLVAFAFAGCSDDIPEPKSNEALYGIYSRGADEFMEIDDLDWIYQYNLEDFDGERFWIKRKLNYLYEPASGIVLREDPDGLLQVDKVISNTPRELTLCWMETPMTDSPDGGNDVKMEIIQVFFNQDLKPDPANYRTYERITPDQLRSGLGDIEVIEAY